MIKASNKGAKLSKFNRRNLRSMHEQFFIHKISFIFVFKQGQVLFLYLNPWLNCDKGAKKLFKFFNDLRGIVTNRKGFKLQTKVVQITEKITEKMESVPPLLCINLLLLGRDKQRCSTCVFLDKSQ